MTSPPPAALAGGTPVTLSPKRRATRGRLMDAAAEVFAEVGFGAASVELVVERAGFTRGAFYSNFDSKEQLLLATTERGLSRSLDALATHLETLQHHSGAFDTDELGTLLTEVLGASQADPGWHRVVLEFRLLALRDPIVAAAYADHDRRFSARLVELLDLALARMGRVRTQDPDACVAVLRGTYEAVLTSVLLAGEPHTELGVRAREPLTAALRAMTKPLPPPQ